MKKKKFMEDLTKKYNVDDTRKNNESDFNIHGINIDGLNKDGLNINGLDENGLDKNGYNINGVDKYGVDKNGLNINGIEGNRIKYPKRNLITKNTIIIFCMINMDLMKKD